MTRNERSVFDALLPADPGRQPPLGLFDAGFDDFYPEFMRTSPRDVRLAVRGALLAAGWLSPLLIRRLPPFSRLGPEDRERALEAMGKSRSYLLRQALMLLKAAASFCYGAHPEVREALKAR